MAFKEAKESRLRAGDRQFFPSKTDARCHGNASVLRNSGRRAPVRESCTLGSAEGARKWHLWDPATLSVEVQLNKMQGSRLEKTWKEVPRKAGPESSPHISGASVRVPGAAGKD